MYNPKFNKQSETAPMFELIENHPLGTWVVMLDGQLLINHIPFLIDNGAGEFGTLRAHLALANPLSQALASCESVSHSIVVFRGEQSFISPSWYPSKQEHGKVVPTWNYMVVHAAGKPRLFTDRAWLLHHVTQLTDLQEAAGQDSAEANIPWKVDDAPAAFIDAQLKGIVGIEIPLESLTGKWKLGQNRNEVDRRSLERQYSFCGLDEMTAGLSIS